MNEQHWEAHRDHGDSLVLPLGAWQEKWMLTTVIPQQKLETYVGDGGGVFLKWSAI